MIIVRYFVNWAPGEHSWMRCAFVSDIGELRFKVRTTWYSRQQKKQTHRNAVFTGCQLLTVHHGASPASTGTQLQVSHIHNLHCVQTQNRPFMFVEKLVKIESWQGACKVATCPTLCHRMINGISSFKRFKMSLLSCDCSKYVHF